MELNKNNIIKDLEGLNASKIREIEDMRNLVTMIKKDILEVRRELENEKANSREVSQFHTQNVRIEIHE